MIEDDVWEVLDLLERHFGEVEVSYEQHQWRWRRQPFGVCLRCYWPSHTLGPDGGVWHPFCWDDWRPPSAYDQWALRRFREEPPF